MLGNALGALVALLGLFGVGAVVCAIVWTLFAWSGRWFDWLLSFVPPLRLASITTCAGWLVGCFWVRRSPCHDINGAASSRVPTPHVAPRRGFRRSLDFCGCAIAGVKRAAGCR